MGEQSKLAHCDNEVTNVINIYHQPSDFHIGTIFYGAVNHTACRVVNIYRERRVGRKGKEWLSKKVYVSYEIIKTGKIYVTEMDVLCRCNISVLPLI